MQSSLGLEQKDGTVAKVEVNEVLGFCAWSVLLPLPRGRRHTMGDEAPEVTAHDAMPSGTLATIKLEDNTISPEFIPSRGSKRVM
jgi:hypothetical protein